MPISQENSFTDKFNPNSTLKVEKGRRRIAYSVSPIEDNATSLFQVIIESTETEDDNELSKKIKLPVYNLLAWLFNPFNEVNYQIQNRMFKISDVLSSCGTSKKFLAISILRI